MLILLLFKKIFLGKNIFSGKLFKQYCEKRLDKAIVTTVSFFILGVKYVTGSKF